MPRLFQVLRALSARELSGLEKYLHSPAFNSREDIQLLLQAYRKIPTGQAAQPEQLWQAVYSGQPFLLRDWRLLLSRTLKQVEGFLVFRQVEEEEALKKLLLAKAYRRLQLTPFFERAIREGHALLQNRECFDSESLHLHYRLEDAYYDYVASHKRQEATNLQEASDCLSHYFMATKLKQACLAHSRHITNQENYRIGMQQAVLEEIAAHPVLLQVPAIAVYYSCYRAVVEGGDEADFQQLRQVMDQYQAGFPNSEMRDIYMLAINYCIRRANTGDEPFVPETLALYRQSLGRGYLLEDGVIPESTFGNIISLALRMKEYDWAEGFTEQFQARLPPAFRQPLYLFSIGKLRYAQQKPTAALRALAKVEAKAPFLYLGAKILQVKIFYETGETDALDSLLASLQAYLRRQKKLGYRRAHYQLFITFSRRLMQLAPYDEKGRQILLDDIRASAGFQEKEWFLLQLE
ncbi:MAG: hypothetical protein H6557_14050 [Lewinellaceae bacterium]|nr:hypothetical protein [Phaeodactylibacter sp.]MCB9037733.1 hypothetical protein [Lewinellaceae bacterium]